jgi:hypothetical protein
MDTVIGHLNKVLEYAAKGLRVFPLFYVLKEGGCSCRREKCNRVGKHPTVRNGLHEATTDEATIRQWWTDMPWANIGLATGHGGLVVLDVDSGPKKDKSGAVIGKKVGKATFAALIAANEPLPNTLAVKTGSGGLHLYFLTTEDIKNSAGAVGEDIDVRGQGGYVILPPSNHETGGKYEWIGDPDAPGAIADLPEWLRDKMLTKRHIDAAAHFDPVEGEEVKKHSENKEPLSNDQLVKLLCYIPADCDRESWWHVGAALKKELGEEKGWNAFEEWSKTGGAKYDADVTRRHWDSFRPDQKGANGKAISGGTIVHYAKANGFRGFDREAADSEEFKQNWVYIAAIKRFVETNRLTEWDKEQFDAMFSPMFERGKPSEHVLRNPLFRHIEGATYWPGQEMYVTEGGQEKLNYWRSSGVTPAPGDVSPLLNHVRYLWPDGAPEGDILLDYLAYQVQHPGEKVHWAVLIEGDQGTGKSYFAAVMRAVLGEHNVSMVANDELHETFTGWQRNTQLVVVEEMMAKQRQELMNKLKPMITESWCTIREMYRPPYKQPNRFNFMFFTNHRNSIIIDDTDRRYCVLKTMAKPHPRQNAYYGPLFDWTRRNAPALLHYLLNERKLDGFQPKAHAPMTAGKREVILQSMPALDRWLYEHFEERQRPCGNWDLIKPIMLVKPAREAGINTSPKQIGIAFANLGYLSLGEKKWEGSETRFFLWAVRDKERYQAMSVSQLQQRWLNQLNSVQQESVDSQAIFDEAKGLKAARDQTPFQ